MRTPSPIPSQSLAALDLKNAPCPQSCWIMKIRNMNPAAGTARTKVSQYPYRSENHISVHNAKKDRMDDSNCQILLWKLGSRYRSSIGSNAAKSSFAGVRPSIMDWLIMQSRIHKQHQQTKSAANSLLQQNAVRRDTGETAASVLRRMNHWEIFPIRLHSRKKAGELRPGQPQFF